MSPGCFINAPCGAGLLPFLLWKTINMHKAALLPQYLGVVGESWALKGLSSAHYLHLDRPVITKTLCSFSFLVWVLWTRCLLPSLLQALYCLYFTSCSLLLSCSICVLSLTPLNSLSHFLTFLLINSLSGSSLINLEFKKGRLSPSCMNLEQLHILANSAKYQYPSQLIWKWNGAAWIRKIVDIRNW